MACWAGSNTIHYSVTCRSLVHISRAVLPQQWRSCLWTRRSGFGAAGAKESTVPQAPLTRVLQPQSSLWLLPQQVLRSLADPPQRPATLAVLSEYLHSGFSSTPWDFRAQVVWNLAGAPLRHATLQVSTEQSTLTSLLLSDLLVGSLPKQVVWNLADPPQRPAALKVLASAANLTLRNPGRAGWEGAKIASVKSGFLHHDSAP